MADEVDMEWQEFLENDGDSSDDGDEDVVKKYLDGKLSLDSTACLNSPKCSDIYISTKTKIAYLSREIDLNKVFWQLDLLPYSTPREGIIKKQMKFITNSEEELAELRSKYANEEYFDEHILTKKNNLSGRIKYKDVRKVSIGICKKDILSYRGKKRGAFYNCFVIILRVNMDGVFQEIHVKIFNTGKMEIPGVKTDSMLNYVLHKILDILRPLVCDSLRCKDETETVLINSNFSCNYYIDRSRLFDILKYKYQIDAVYDPCSYPGIQCKFCYKIGCEEQDGVCPLDAEKDSCKSVSFMIFRTGSVLIVGKCDVDELEKIYGFLKNILVTEHQIISESTTDSVPEKKTDKPRKQRRKVITITD